MIYRAYVYPIYPISLRTMHYYLKLIREGETPPKEEQERGLYPLFDAWDSGRNAWDT